MGGSQSKVEVVYKPHVVPVKVEVESEQSKKYRKLLQADKQLEKIQQEIACLDPVITGYRSQCGSSEAAVIVQYEGDIDKDTIASNIEVLFPNNPCKNELIETATSMLMTIKTTDEIRDVLKWEKRTLYKTVEGKVFGFELQYKIKYFDELKGRVYGFRSNETTLLVAYKSALYVMDEDPEDFPDSEQLKAIKM
uniref:Uncharacterized protein n=1 Tax=Amphimedon queenslandica TaxID=400682 RepID=A0A1X7U7C8_AMPQE